MALSCGCEFFPGQPVSIETLKNHYRHTLEALVFWELLFRKPNTLDKKPEPANLAKELRLSEARIQFIEAIEERFPELAE